MTDTDPLTAALEEAIRFGIEHEPDYWGGGADDEAYIRAPARKMAATLVCPDPDAHELLVEARDVLAHAPMVVDQTEQTAAWETARSKLLARLTAALEDKPSAVPETDTDRLAAALRTVLLADPTLICPDPADHALALPEPPRRQWRDDPDDRG